MKDIQFLLIDNANFGSIVIDHIKTEFPVINENLQNKDLNFNLNDHKNIINRYIDIYLHILFYFNEYYGIPLANIIFFRDCSHSLNWRKKIISTYKDGKSRFADESTYVYFNTKNSLLEKMDNIDIPLEEKWKIEDTLDDLKLEVKRNEKFIHDLAGIERCIHFFLNDNLCSLSERNCCEADEQIFVCSQYLISKYPNSSIKILSNDTDMLQCINNSSFIDKCMNKSPRNIINKNINIIKCFRNNFNLFNFKDITSNQPNIEKFIIHKVFCGKKNDNLPDPSNNIYKNEWFNDDDPNVYNKSFIINKNNILNSLKKDTILESNIKNNIICSSFYYIPSHIYTQIINNCIKIEDKIITRDGGFKPSFSDKGLFIKYLPLLKDTVNNWLTENIVRYTLGLILNNLTKHIGRDIILNDVKDNDAYVDYSNILLQTYEYEINRCNVFFLIKYIKIWFTGDNWVGFVNEFHSGEINRNLDTFISKLYVDYVEKIRYYINIIGIHYLTIFSKN